MNTIWWATATIVVFMAGYYSALPDSKEKRQEHCESLLMDTQRQLFDALSVMETKR